MNNLISIYTYTVYILIFYGYCLYIGVSGATVQRNLEYQYWNTSQFARASQYNKNATIVLILLGTNDSKQSAWNMSRFYVDYSSMVRHFKGFQSRSPM